MPEGSQPRRSRALLGGYIHGSEDNRVDIDMVAHVMPLSAVGYLALGDGSCTGALVGPKTVLTAAHCLYDTHTHKWSSAA